MPSKVVALWCWYHGQPFHGYQTQKGYRTVQETVMAALRAAGFERNPVPSGRTDRGVHARMQVLSMRVVEGVPAEEVSARLNAVMDASELGIAASVPAPPKFHAAWSASGKEYRYRLGPQQVDGLRPAHWRVEVEPEALNRALEVLVGAHDFGAFCDASAPRRVRAVRSIEVMAHRTGPLVVRVEGDGFGRFMVRGMVGAAVQVASGERSMEQLRAALASGTGKWMKAPPEGLTLWEVKYPAQSDPFTKEQRERAAGVPEWEQFR